MRHCVLALLMYFSIAMSAQVVTPVTKTLLPAVLNESSGIEVTDRNHFWSHNDSGGNHELYEFDSTGTLLKTLNILYSSNIDWEDIARDSAGNAFIGDFGNNSNNRNNQVIYKIGNPDTVSGSNVVPEEIKFSYSDQHAFPPVDSLKYFDMEGFFWYRGALYLFSKNRTNPYNGYAHVYKLPDTPGTHVAQLIDSFYTGTGPVYLTSITAADISPDGTNMALLCGAHIFLFSNFTGERFFDGTVQRLDFASLTQKEAIVFLSSNELFITDEKTDNQGLTGKLYYLDLSSLIPSKVSTEGAGEVFTISPNPVNHSQISLQLNAKMAGGILKLFDMSGKVVYETSAKDHVFISDVQLPIGTYVAEVTLRGKSFKQKLIIY